MGLGETIKSALGGVDVPPELLEMARSGNINLPLSGDAENMLGELIGKGKFGSRGYFLTFIVKQYFMNNMGSMMSGDRNPPESAIVDIIRKTGLDMGFADSDVKKMLVPLLIQAFYAVYKIMSRRQAMKPA